MVNDEVLKSTSAMEEYMEFVFQKVIELYKDTVPDIIARAFDIDIEEVENLTLDDIKRKFDLNLRYQYVEPKQADSMHGEKIQKPHIKYIDNLFSNLVMSIAIRKRGIYTQKQYIVNANER